MVKDLPASSGHASNVDSIPGSWKISWRRARQPSPVFLPGESPWIEEPGGLQFIGLKESDTTEMT